MLCLFILILGIICFASFIPICQYLYYNFIKKDSLPLRYFFSKELFERNFDEDIRLHPSLMCKVINNREEMQRLWDMEMKHKLP